MKQLLFVTIFFILGCQSDPEQKLKHLEGYWEIVQVEQNDRTIKSFKINPDIDYFKVYNNQSGFRKKLKPRFDGSFETSRDTLKFDIEILDNKLYLTYRNDILTLKEQVIEASSNKLIINNLAGFIYTYKPYVSLELNQ